MAGGSIKAIACGFLTMAMMTVCLSGADAADSHSGVFSGLSSYSQRKQVINSLPLDRLTKHARQRILSIVKSPTIYRRLPTQAIDCDQDMFLFLTRQPEVLVGMWDLMGITNVQAKRTGPYQLHATDGSGTTCKVDLIYGDQHLHIYVADGSYDGRMVAKPIRGKGVFVLRSRYAKNAEGRTTVTGTLDCFVQFDSLGADLVARTLSGVIGRSADNNFTETARFIGQVSQAAEKNPVAMIDIAQRLPQVSEHSKKHFTQVITSVTRRAHQQSTAPQRTIKPVSTRKQ